MGSIAIVETGIRSPPASSASSPSTSLELAGKVALVTGGSQGIGQAVAAALVGQGAQVVITYSSNKSAADDTVRRLGVDKVVAIRSHAGKVEDVQTLVDKVVKGFGKIDILIANAGQSPAKTLEETTEADFDETMAINVKGPYFLAQKAIPHMPAGSRIIFVSTSLCNTSQVMADKLMYCTTKGAVEQMTRVMAKGLGKKQITVNCVAPGPTATDLYYKGKSEQLLQVIARFSPFERVGTVEEVADAFLFLCGKRASWVTGQTLRVNGGSA